MASPGGFCIVYNEISISSSNTDGNFQDKEKDDEEKDDERQRMTKKRMTHFQDKEKDDLLKGF